MNIELRITDPGIPVTLHSCRHTTPIFCAETLANFELEFIVKTGPALYARAEARTGKSRRNFSSFSRKKSM